MMSPRESFETIAAKLEAGMEAATVKDAAYFCMVQAHTHAIIQAATLRRSETRAEFREHVAQGGTVQ